MTKGAELKIFRFKDGTKLPILVDPLCPPGKIFIATKGTIERARKHFEESLKKFLETGQ